MAVGATAASGVAGAFSIVFSKIFSEGVAHRWIGKVTLSLALPRPPSPPSHRSPAPFASPPSQGDTSVLSNGVTWASFAGILACFPAQVLLPSRPLWSLCPRE